MKSSKISNIVFLVVIGGLLGAATSYFAVKLLSTDNNNRSSLEETQLTPSDIIPSNDTKTILSPSTDEANQQITITRRSAIVEAAEKVGPAVVSISVIQTQIFRQANPGHGADFWNYFFFGPREYHKQVSSLGSGIIINPEGYILTNDHVAHGAESITVTLTSGEQYQAKLIGSDESTDLAVLKIISDKQDFPFAILGDSNDLFAGEWAIAIGNPFGYLLDDTKPTVTVGVVSAVNRDIKPEAGQKQVYRNMIQTDAAINPGNSGGPLVNASGEVIGINTFIFTSSRGSEGIGFAIPINRAKSVISDLINIGEVVKAWVGLRVAQITPIVAQGLGLDMKTGLIVTSVDDMSPAKKAGILPGDALLEIGSDKIKNQSDWEEVVAYARVGEELNIIIRRGSDSLNITLTPEELPIKKAPSYTDRFGLEVASITKQLSTMYGLNDNSGVMIAKVNENSIASSWELREGDIIRRINRQKITCLSDYKKTVDNIGTGYRILFFIERQGEMYYLTVIV
ncbi:MAG: trypsin-like peptidase domain-containing protein [candidate division Zixibacteria bacterium]|nr:trypsin-like peptidase domain-containing protein [candidate division Zixibacteria bacterium]